jgi:hypothetical protein
VRGGKAFQKGALMETIKITQHHSHRSCKGKALVIIPHWGSVPFTYQLFARFIYGFHGVVYHYSSALLSADVGATLRHFRTLEQIVLEDVRQLQRGGASMIAIYGTSLGTVMAARIANKLAAEKVNIRLILNLCSASFPFAVWNGRATQSVRRNLEKQGVTLKELEAQWGYLSPIENLDHLYHCRILAFLSIHDQVTVPSNVARLDQKLRSFPNTEIHRNGWLGHRFGGVKNLFSLGVVKTFLA